MSTKFNRRPVPRRRPAICIKPFGSCRPPFNTQYPPQLWATVVWVDLDPLDPIQGYGGCPCYPTGADHNYEGISPPATVRIACRFEPTGPPNHWTFISTLHFHDHIPADYYWLDKYVDPNKPFDTGLLQVTHIPRFDYHRLRVTT